MDGEEFSAYDKGARLGMFDKCNGIARKSFDNVQYSVYNTIYADGYNDAYDANEARICLNF